MKKSTLQTAFMLSIVRFTISGVAGTEGATFLEGFGGMLPRENLKSRTSGMAFPAISRVEGCY